MTTRSPKSKQCVYKLWKRLPSVLFNYCHASIWEVDWGHHRPNKLDFVSLHCCFFQGRQIWLCFSPPELIFVTDITDYMRWKICHKEKFQISVKNLKNLWSFHRNLCRFCSKFVWRKICVEEISVKKRPNMRPALHRCFFPRPFMQWFWHSHCSYITMFGLQSFYCTGSRIMIINNHYKWRCLKYVWCLDNDC